ncbi:MAG: hypothetical protein DMG39_16940 [Acidobacteria bacterium]|nr:MAG: hypothetical protein DMG39_16940 [Acidobacteriota bacterium]
MSFCHFVLLFPLFFEHDFRLKKEANALPGGPRRFPARAVKAARFAFTDGLDRTSGRESALLRQEGQKKKRVPVFPCCLL